MGEFVAAALTALTVSIAANITLDCFGNSPWWTLDLHERLDCSYRPSNWTKDIALFWLHLQEDRSNCYGPHAVWLAGPDQAFPVDQIKVSKNPFFFFLPVWLLSQSRWFKHCWSSKISFNFWFFYLLVMPVALPSHVLTYQHVTVFIWGCYSMLRCSLSSFFDAAKPESLMYIGNGILECEDFPGYSYCCTDELVATRAEHKKKEYQRNYKSSTRRRPSVCFPVHHN